MPRCWTCGGSVINCQFTCVNCVGMSRLKSWRKALESPSLDYSDGISPLAKNQREAAASLSSLPAGEVAGVASAIEWGFEDFRWNFQLQAKVLLDIDHTIKSLAQTQANEWRLLAEELRRRGVLSDSEKFFLKALEANLLDYRIYRGLAMTYLERNQFEDARTYLEKSLLHAPNDEERGFSRRLTGHIDECEENYPRATSALRSAIELAPAFSEAQYAYARCSARTGDMSNCLGALRQAILANTLFWYLVQHDPGFDSARTEVQALLATLHTEAAQAAMETIAKAEIALREAAEAVKTTTSARTKARSLSNVDLTSFYEQASWNFGLAKEKISPGEFPAFQDGKAIAERARGFASKAKVNAQSELESLQKRRIEKTKEAWVRVPRVLATWAVLFAPLGGIGGALLNVALRPDIMELAARNGFILGVPFGIGVGVLYGIKRAYVEFRPSRRVP
jgi:tetratricopeptide (TPR) repeat protein